MLGSIGLLLAHRSSSAAAAGVYDAVGDGIHDDTAAISSSKFALSPTPAPGGFEIQVNGVAWFASGNVSVTVGGTTYSQYDGSLKPVGTAAKGSGSDTLGAFTSTTQKWTAGKTPYTTSARLYGDKFAIFEQRFPSGAEGTNITYSKGSNIVSSCFPSIDPQPSKGKRFGYVWWGGRAFLEGSVGGTLVSPYRTH